MRTLASITAAPADARVRDVVRPLLPDGRRTTVHVARWDGSRTRVRVARLASQLPLAEWCVESGTPDALVGGFYTRPAGLPLGELRLAGAPAAHVPFTAPWDATRASLHVAERGAVRIDRRDALPPEPDGALLQAGPLLVRDGEIVCHDGEDPEGFSRAAGQFDSDITAGRHPRAAFGIGDGTLIAVVADGRSPTDAGLTLGELAAVMTGLGASAAMNLDGGGSASLVWDGQLRNRPREQHGIDLHGGRAITTVIAFDPSLIRRARAPPGRETTESRPMAGPRRVVSAILFSPRGGSSHATRALSAGLPAEGWAASLVAGSRGDAGPEQDAHAFYAGQEDLTVVDFTAALRAPDPMDPGPGIAPMHPSYEDRPGAPDRVFAALDDAAFERQVRTWSAALRVHEAAGADVLHLHHLTPIDAAAAAVAPHTPVVTQLHGTELLMLEAIDDGNGTAWPYADAWADRLRAWAQRSTRLVIATPGGRARAGRLLGVPPEQIAVVPNGVDAERFSPAPVDRAATWRRVLADRPLGWVAGSGPGSWRASPEAVEALRDDTILLYVGRFTAVKRVPLLIEAFTAARRRLGGGVSLVIVGGHPGEWEGEHPAEAITRLNAEGVLLAGWHAQLELPALLRASDAVVLPSVNESFGQVIVEGMACGLPAIAVDHGGPAEILEDGETGWLVPPDDVAALEGAIVAATTEAPERERRGALARREVLAHYTWDAATRALSDVLGDAALERPAGRPIRSAPTGSPAPTR